MCYRSNTVFSKFTPNSVPKNVKNAPAQVLTQLRECTGNCFSYKYEQIRSEKKNSLVSSGSFTMIINLLIYSSLPYCRGRGRAFKYIFGQISPPVSFHWALLLKEFDLKRPPFFKDFDRFHQLTPVIRPPYNQARDNVLPTPSLGSNASVHAQISIFSEPVQNY